MGEGSKGLQEQEASAMFILADTLPVIPAKLVKRIQKGEFVDMAEQLKDNIEAERRRLAVAENGSSHNPRREIPNLLGWLYCYSLFAAIVCAKYPDKAKEMWAYQATIIGESRRCGGNGWHLYDTAFRQQMSSLENTDFFRMVPVHPADRKLLGTSWNGQTYVDVVLPFRLRSAPKIFTAVADALQYILQEQGIVHILHYLDDFLLLGRSGKADCEKGLHIAMEMCHRLGVPIAEHKTEGSTQVLTFLGIEVDSERMEVRLPEDKLHCIQEEIKLWTGRKSTTKRELLSLIGQLQHACCVVRPGRIFLQRMIELSAGVKQLHYRVQLNKGF